MYESAGFWPSASASANGLKLQFVWGMRELTTISGGERFLLWYLSILGMSICLAYRAKVTKAIGSDYITQSVVVNPSPEAEQALYGGGWFMEKVKIW